LQSTFHKHKLTSIPQAFLLTNFVLSGPPLFLFILFSITVLIFAIVVALIIGLLVAVGFTLFCVCLALIILFPIVFFTTLAATFFFLWGLGGYYLMKWMNKGGSSPAPQGGAIGDKLNSLTGGRLDFIMGPARDSESKDQLSKNPATTPEKVPASKKQTNGNTPTSNGYASDAKKHVDTVKKNANVGNAANKITSGTANVNAVTDKAGVNGVAKQAGVDGVTKSATDVGGLKNKVGTTTGTLKGTVGGATGLA